MGFSQWHKLGSGKEVLFLARRLEFVQHTEKIIRQLLSHARRDATPIYVDVTIHQLREVHARCHSHRLRSPAGLPSAASAASSPP